MAPRRIIAALATLAALGTSVAHAAPSSMTFSTNWRTRACVVEQQSGLRQFDPCPGPTVVNNPTLCSWDIDDSWIDVAMGDVLKGATASAAQCRIVDGRNNIRLIEFSAYSASDNLVVRIDSNVGSWDVVPFQDGNAWRYRFCLRAWDIGPQPYTEIPGSNGGVGLQVDYSVTLTAPSRSARDISAVLKNGVGTWSTGCP